MAGPDFFRRFADENAGSIEHCQQSWVILFISPWRFRRIDNAGGYLERHAGHKGELCRDELSAFSNGDGAMPPCLNEGMRANGQAQADRGFVAAVEKGSMAKAALEQQITPVMLGRRIDALEKRLGAKLMHRSTRHLALTEQGTVFLDHCRKLLGLAWHST